MLCSPSKRLPGYLTRFCRFHRVFLDESHEAVHQALAQHGDWVESCKYRWALSATPITSSLHLLAKQYGFIRIKNPALEALFKEHESLTERRKKAKQHGTLFVPRRLFDNLVSEIQKVMIRHTKAQRIGGEQALALPTLKSETIWLDMNEVEKLAYAAACRADASASRFRTALREGSEAFALEMTLCGRRQTCSNDFSLVARSRSQSSRVHAA